MKFCILFGFLFVILGCRQSVAKAAESQRTKRPFVSIQVEDPKFKELLTEEPNDFPGFPCYSYIFNARRFRALAKRMGWRYSLEELEAEAVRYKLRATDRSLQYFQHVTGSGLAVTKGFKDSYEGSAQKAIRENKEGKLWALHGGGELYYWNTNVDWLKKGIFYVEFEEPGELQDIKKPPGKGEEDRWKAWDAEIKKNYGFGGYGMPDSNEDHNPFKWIAFRQWVSDKLTQTFKETYADIKKKNPDLILIAPDMRPGLGYLPDDHEARSDIFTVFTTQTLHFVHEKNNSVTGFKTKILKDTTGKKVWPMPQMGRYQGVARPQEVRERFSQIFRNGGDGIFLLPNEWWDSLFGDMKFANPRSWEATKEILAHIIKMNKVAVPKSADTAVLLSSDHYSSFSWTKTNRQGIYELYLMLGPITKSWFHFISDRQIDRGIKSPSAYKIVWVPRAKYERRSVIEALKNYVKNGGTLICGDPEAFSFTLDGKEASDREELFGISLGKYRWQSQYIQFRSPLHLQSGKAFARGKRLRTYGGSYETKIVGENTEIVAEFSDHLPAITLTKYGKGIAVYFATDAFHKENVNDADWAELIKAIQIAAGAKTNQDIWRFTFPEYKPKGPHLPGKCLTGNHLTVLENMVFAEHNEKIEGGYKYSLAPDKEKDQGGAGEFIPFSLGDLTDRALNLKNWNPRKSEFQVADWVVTWEKTDPLSITFDLKSGRNLTETRLWYSGQLPELTVSGSLDGKTFVELGKTGKRRATQDVLDVFLKLRGKYQYLKFEFGPRDPGEILTLAELEIWGE